MDEITVTLFSVWFGFNVKTFLAEFWMDGMDLYRRNKYVVNLMNAWLPADKLVMLAIMHGKW